MTWLSTRFCCKFSLVLMLFCCLAPLWGQDRRQEEEEAAKYYDKWLNQDVVYIITDEERAVFEELTTLDEKDRFIEQFWQRRDTDLRTAINEYKEEHYRRIAHANQRFGSGIPGWKTDRGRVYIMFGEPAQVEYHAGGDYLRKPYEGGGRTASFPFEIWRYRYLPGVGDDIEIEFVDRSFAGEFKMAIYPWEKDMLLHVDSLGETTSERLGRTQRYYRPGLHPGNLNNTMYMSRHLGARIKDRPFERMLQYYALQRPPEIHQRELQSVVETRISFSQLSFASDLHYLWIDTDSALVPITVEVPNQSLTYVRQGDNLKARVGIYGRVTSLSGKILAEFEQTLASLFPEEYFEQGRKQGSLYQKTVALEPGRYKLDLVVKDLESGDVGTQVKTISLPRPEDGALQASPIILAEQLESLDAFPETPETFVIGDVRVVPKVSRGFRNGEAMGIYLQVYNPTLDSTTLEPAVSVEYTVLKGGKVFEQFSDEEGASVEFFSPQRLVLVKKLKLLNFEKGRYQLSVRVDDSVSGQTSTAQADFEVLGD